MRDGGGVVVEESRCFKGQWDSPEGPSVSHLVRSTASYAIDITVFRGTFYWTPSSASTFIENEYANYNPQGSHNRYSTDHVASHAEKVITSNANDHFALLQREISKILEPLNLPRYQRGLPRSFRLNFHPDLKESICL